MAQTAQGLPLYLLGPGEDPSETETMPMDIPGLQPPELFEALAFFEASPLGKAAQRSRAPGAKP